MWLLARGALVLIVTVVDCLYWEGGDDFPRLEAPTETRDRIRAAWGLTS
jgi:hypothetical protein